MTARDAVESVPIIPWNRCPPSRGTRKPWHTLQESVLTTQRHIIGAWKDGHEAETSGIDNLLTYALVEAAYKAAEEKRAVEPEAVLP